MKGLAQFKQAFSASRVSTLMISMLQGVTGGHSDPVMAVEVSTDKKSYVPGEEVLVSVHLLDFAERDQGYGYMNFIVQYDSSVFENGEYVNRFEYDQDAYAPGDYVHNPFQFDVSAPKEGHIYVGMNPHMRGIDIQVESRGASPIPAADQTLITFKLRVKEEAWLGSTDISLANEFTRVRTSDTAGGDYLYSPDVTPYQASISVTSPQPASARRFSSGYERFA